MLPLKNYLELSCCLLIPSATTTVVFYLGDKTGRDEWSLAFSDTYFPTATALKLPFDKTYSLKRAPTTASKYVSMEFQEPGGDGEADIVFNTETGAVTGSVNCANDDMDIFDIEYVGNGEHRWSKVDTSFFINEKPGVEEEDAGRMELVSSWFTQQEIDDLLQQAEDNPNEEVDISIKVYYTSEFRLRYADWQGQVSSGLTF